MPRIEALVLVAGLAGASAAGVVAYDKVGPYGDGFATVGLYRTLDPQTKTPLLIRKVTRPDGAVVFYVFNERTRTFAELRTAGADGSAGSGKAGSDVRLHFKDGAPVVCEVYPSNKFIYLFYPYDIDGTDSTGPTTSRLTRITASGDVMLAGSER